MSLEIQGIIHLYGATGEATRPQFIGNSSLDKDGRVKNYDEVYDIQPGDKIKLEHKSFANGVVTVNVDVLAFLLYLTALWRSEDIKATFIPHSEHKSWAGIIKEPERSGAW